LIFTSTDGFETTKASTQKQYESFSTARRQQQKQQQQKQQQHRKESS